jgi:hypothetical protein
LIDRHHIDHGILSPSGHVSKRTREATIKKLGAELFPPGYWEATGPTPEEKAETRRLANLSYAKFLMGLPGKKHRKLAEQLIEENKEKP